MFRPPVNRMMRTLDRSFFKKTVPMAAATVFDKRQIGPVKNALLKTKEICDAPRIIPVRPVPLNGKTPEEGIIWDLRKEKMGGELRDHTSLKCVLLDEKVRPHDKTTWSPVLQELVDKSTIEVFPYNLLLDYDYWNYEDIISSILPENQVDEAPVGFANVGHIAHFNIRDEYLPYRYLIAEILLDKQSIIKSVINKIDDVGSTSQFRTFEYELLGGSPDMNVTVRQQNCDFSFNYSKVYWNTRLEPEHTKLCQEFQKGQAVCDVMAGVGPFAIPAGKKHVFVWANDLNPHAFECLQANSKKNKTYQFVKAFNEDGREFIKKSTKKLITQPLVTIPLMPKKIPRTKPTSPKKDAKIEAELVTCPRTFDHYVMNLPATAVEFLDAFRSVYAGHENLFEPRTSRKLPLVHVYCFSTNSPDIANEERAICERVSKALGYTFTREDIDGKHELQIRPVRLVSPNKQMFCVTFRLPEEVAFAKD
ncbi:tRNA methyltransferase Trm5 [Ascosphaera apis ARSEF 7405]|uniref:tRNA (guanine(37)-N1)-methyltransferase n=1 Tax=Ascosphaera apis ARSEF 7405 TaxID=392613 RepID=A0A167WHA7_9EURO|nr:tRNA methyltransferase Trm5 [Ascosphaera apis ARSEF 7405]